MTPKEILALADRIVRPSCSTNDAKAARDLLRLLAKLTEATTDEKIPG